MSEALIITPPVSSSVVAETEAQGASALAMLPTEWAKPVAFFALAKLYLLRTRGPLCVNLKYWISKGLELDEAKAIFRRLCDPEVSRGHNFENQLMADLAGMVADCFRRKKLAEETRIRREADAAPESGAAVAVKLADYFTMPRS